MAVHALGRLVHRWRQLKAIMWISSVLLTLTTVLLQAYEMVQTLDMILNISTLGGTLQLMIK